MKKTLKSIIISTLSCQLLLTSALPVVIYAEDGEGAQQTPPPSTEGTGQPQTPPQPSGEGTGTGTGETGTGGTPNTEGGSNSPGTEDDKKDEGNPPREDNPEGEPGSSQTDSSSNQTNNQDNPRQETVQRVQNNLGQTQRQSINRNQPAAPVETRGTRIEVTSDHEDKEDDEEDKKENKEEVASDVKELVEQSLHNPAYEQAYHDYEKLISDFEIQDLTVGPETGSSLEEFQGEFEASVEGSVEEAGEDTIIRYNYEVDGQKAQMLVYFFGGSILYAGIIDTTPTVNLDTLVSKEGMATLSGEEAKLSDLTEIKPTVIGVAQMNNGGHYETIVSIMSGEEAEPYAEMVTIDGEHVKVAYRALLHEIQETMLTEMFKVISSEVSGVPVDSEAEESEDKEVEEEQQETEEVSEESFESSEIATLIKPNQEYDASRVVDLDKLDASYQELVGKLNEGTAFSPQQIMEVLGEPTNIRKVEDRDFLEYFAITDARVLVVNVLIGNDNNVVSLEYEDRTADIYTPFKVNKDDIVALGAENPNVDQVVERIGRPTKIEHQYFANRIRYIWASEVDPQLFNIEAIQDLGTGELSLFYYER